MYVLGIRVNDLAERRLPTGEESQPPERSTEPVNRWAQIVGAWI